MLRLFKVLSFSLFVLVVLSCQAQRAVLKIPAENPDTWIDKVQGKRLALVVNQTSLVKKDLHLVDYLIGMGIKIKVIFQPEHGFRGIADAGANIKDSIDAKTKIKLISLYGKNKKPQPIHLKDIDLILFDIQDVGCRFYTYISTLQYVMEAAAENNKDIILLDRPNPNRHYVAGPVLSEGLKSFVGMQKVPVVYGMTIGEYAQFLNGEGLLEGNVKAKLQVIQLINYKGSTRYILPVKPSPNLPNQQSIELYPSLCLFEGTNVSVGRGTDFPFQVYGSPDKSIGEFSFTPQATPGALNPMYKGQTCYGADLRTVKAPEFTISYVVDAYSKSSDRAKFFVPFFDKLIGNTEVKNMISAGKSAQEIEQTWQADLAEFKKVRAKYLLYKD